LFGAGFRFLVSLLRETSKKSFGEKKCALLKAAKTKVEKKLSLLAGKSVRF